MGAMIAASIIAFTPKNDSFSSCSIESFPDERSEYEMKVGNGVEPLAMRAGIDCGIFSGGVIGLHCPKFDMCFHEIFT